MEIHKEFALPVHAKEVPVAGGHETETKGMLEVKLSHGAPVPNEDTGARA